MVSDYLLAPIWILCTGLLLASATRLARAHYPQDPWPALLLHTLVIFNAVIVLCATLLGGLGILYPTLLLIAVAGSAGALLALARRITPSVLTELPKEPKLAAVPWCLLIAFWIAQIINEGLLTFPANWDDLAYHIPLIDFWLQSRNLYAPNSLQWSNPGNNELIGLWMVAPFSGDFLISLNNFPAVLLLASAAVEAGRQAGLRPALAHAVALAVVCNHVVRHQLVLAENDVAVAGLFLACLAYGFRYRRTGQRAELALAAISIGLLAGVKFYALGYAAVAWAAITWLTVNRHGLGSGARLALLALATASLWGGYWYLRNAVVTGAPFYPLRLAQPSDELRDVYSGVWQSSFLGNGRPEIWPMAVQAVWRMTGPVHLAALLALPLTAAWLLVSGALRLRRSNQTADASIRLGLSSSSLAALVVWLATPFAIEDQPGTLNQLTSGYCPVRYGMAFLSVTVIALAVAIQHIAGGASTSSGGGNRVPSPSVRLRWPSSWGPEFGFAAGAGFQFVYHDGRLLCATEESLFIAANLSLGILVMSVCCALWPRLSHSLSWGLAVVALVSGIVACGLLADRWHRDFARFYDERLGNGPFVELDRSLPKSAGVCVLDYRPYPFFGSSRSFVVCQPARVPSYRWLVEYLRDRRVTILAVRSYEHLQNRGWKECVEEVRKHPARFEPFEPYTGTTYEVFWLCGDDEGDSSHGGNYRAPPLPTPSVQIVPRNP